MIKAALFDVYGTCVDWRSGVTQFAGTMLAGKGLPMEMGFAIADQWRGLYDPSMEEVRAGRRPYVPLDVIQLENLDRVLDELKLSDAFNAEDRALLNTAWDRLPAWEDTEQALSWLKTLMPIAACSNGSVAMMKRLARHAHLPWTDICGAGIAENYKPHSTVYLKSCEALGTEPEDTIMIACHTDDLDAASALGLQTGYFPRPLEFGFTGFAADPEPERFTLAADTLSHLIDKIVLRRI